MGKNNKARRAAKAKARAKRRAGSAQGGSARGSGEFHSGAGGFFDPQESVTALWWLAGKAQHGDASDRPQLLARLQEWDAPTADRGLEDYLTKQIAVLWQHGWQPEELRRQARRASPAAAARLLELAILADHDRRGGQAMDPRWIEQISRFSLRDVSTRGSWSVAWREREGLTRAEAYGLAVAAVAVVDNLPPLDELIAPPGFADRNKSRPKDAGASADPVLQRIRKLLSKAESTEFEAEASALTAKAQELMTRHAIDLAMVADPADSETPTMIRIPVDAPYADAKAYLLQVVANASRSRSVSLGSLGMSTVVGHAADLAGVELLFTSLLVQVQNALAESARNAHTGAKTRSQSYRSAFFLAFAHRIEERLAAANQEVYSEAEASSARFLPVLRAREQEIDDFMAERFGELAGGKVRGGYDSAGWAAGRSLGDMAKLDSGELLW